jgi:hypothetical protein
MACGDENKLPDDHASELAFEDDRQWFEANPRRVLRLRHATAGDPIGPGPGHVVFVFCPVNGMRIRPGFTMLPEMRDALMATDTDEALAPYFAIFLNELAQSEAEEGAGQLTAVHGRRLRKMLQLAMSHGRLRKLPSTDVLDAP